MIQLQVMHIVSFENGDPFRIWSGRGVCGDRHHPVMVSTFYQQLSKAVDSDDPCSLRKHQRLKRFSKADTMYERLFQ